MERLRRLEEDDCLRLEALCGGVDGAEVVTMVLRREYFTPS